MDSVLIHLLFPHLLFVCFDRLNLQKKNARLKFPLLLLYFIPLLFAFAISSYIFVKYKLRKNWHVDLIEYLWGCVSILKAILI